MAFNLFDLGQVLNAGAGAVNNFRQQRALGDLGTKIQSGDYKGAAQAALAQGDIGTALKLIEHGDTQESNQKALALAGLGGGLTEAATAPAPTPGASSPRGLRNLNPGNIEAGGFAQSQPGYVGSDGRFAKFDTLEHGVGAQAALLERYGQKGINTVAGVINRWAPQAENGAATGNYAQFVARKIGVDPNAPIDLSNPETRTRLAYAMGEFENGRPISSGPTGQNVQVADASGAIPQSAGGGQSYDALDARLKNLTKAKVVAKKGSTAEAYIDQEIANTNAAMRRVEHQQNLSVQQENNRENRAMRQQQFDAAQQERELRRQERADTQSARQEENAIKRQEAAGKQTVEQGKAMSFADRMDGAQKILDDPNAMSVALGARGAAQKATGAIPVIGGFTQTEDYQKFQQAAAEFTTAALRKDSGATITPAEEDLANRMWIPQPSDKPGVIKQKEEARRTVMESIAREGTPAYRDAFAARHARKNGGATTPKTTGGGSKLPPGWAVEVH